MVVVTEHAVELLTEVLAMNASDPRQSLRIYYEKDDVYMDLDYKKDGDDVVECKGCAILVMSPEVSVALRDAVIDCIHTSDGASLTIYPRGSSSQPQQS